MIFGKSKRIAELERDAKLLRARIAELSLDRQVESSEVQRLRRVISRLQRELEVCNSSRLRDDHTVDL